MSSSILPPPFDHLALRPFSFFPAIVGIEHNEWILREASWSEVLVVNDKTNEEIWIPRRYVGAVSPVEDPVVIVGLTRELEFKGGMLVPFKTRVLKMPGGVLDSTSAPSDGPKPPKGLGLRMDRSDKQAFRLIGVAVGSLVALCVLVLVGVQINKIRQRRITFTAKDAAFESLSKHDDHLAVVEKLGRPSVDRTKESGTIFFEALSYPDRGYIVILTGAEAQTVKYVGTVDNHWKTMHAISEDQRALLQTIEPF